MSKYIVTWNGEDERPDNPASLTFFGVVFPLREPVRIDAVSETAQRMMAKCKINRFFTVEDGEAAPVETAEVEVVKPRKGRPPKVAPTEPEKVSGDGDSEEQA